MATEKRNRTNIFTKSELKEFLESGSMRDNEIAAIVNKFDFIYSASYDFKNSLLFKDTAEILQDKITSMLEDWSKDDLTEMNKLEAYDVILELWGPERLDGGYTTFKDDCRQKLWLYLYSGLDVLVQEGCIPEYINLITFIDNPNKVELEALIEASYLLYNEFIEEIQGIEDNSTIEKFKLFNEWLEENF